MPHATFTRTTVPPNQLIQSVCDLCLRKVAISRRTDLLLSIEAIHTCITAQTGPLRERNRTSDPAEKLRL